MRKNRRKPEEAIQRALVQHYKVRGAPGVFMCAIPNGGYRRPTEAAVFKATGVIAGVPDLLFVRQGQAYFLELKALSGKLSENQTRCLEQLEAAGAICAVAYGLDEALKFLEGKRLFVGEAQ